MNATAYSPYQFSHGFWPFSTCNVKPLELPIHPAFIHSPYPNFNAQCGNSGTTSGTVIRNKSDSFTIDAILSRDRVDEVQHSPDGNPGQYSPVNRHGNKESSSVSRRHARLHENSHPYRSPSDRNVATPTSHPVRKQLDNSPVKDKADTTLKESSLKSDWKTGKGKRIRTIFTPDQLERMEAEFEKQQYMVGTERYYLACSLSLTEAQVKVWFQNRRIKWRKMNLEKQQAKLASFDLFRDVDIETDSIVSDEDDNRPPR
ncbi:homeobox protein vent1-like [Mizuhopecten yessoensis]|uniref:Homeobox protein not2 n=1 Tax=Mizuhopecten yessoensis TaxID=6573 RepID=A0A210QHN8_MIZYE|nr:homeobox protein vent1-like [Mizuhopecten yessoensis]OWF48283.1 Homeobox protein not2 [Mizuhopecten yessoensis]